MMTNITMHVGIITNAANDKIFSTYKESRFHAMKELNKWFFAHFRDAGLAIEQLPVLDDWTWDKNVKWSTVLGDLDVSLDISTF